ncbi:MAG: FG-GAP-like repeat-containing protein [Gemmataceae bacterium]|nr:FG-GAP-like repeat-containing protein [Gemmataceae bacterium]
MSFRSWLQNLRSIRDGYVRRQRGSLRAATHRPNLEVLEDRCLLSFTPGVSIGAGAYPVAADFNNDGRLDLATVTGDETGSTISVALGNGDGTFQQPALTSATGLGPWGSFGAQPQSVAAGDFNGDGNLDLAAATYDEYDYWTYEGYGDGGLVVLLGNGDGTFAAAAPLYTGFPSNYVATGDLDADGKTDLVVTSDDQYGEMGVQIVGVFLGRSDGTFAHQAMYYVEDSLPVGDGPINIYAPVLADFNGDGAADVAVPAGTWVDGALVKVYLGNGNGTLQQPRDVIVFPDAPYYAGIFSVIAGDFDGDARPDLVADGVVLLGNGDGTFRRAGGIGAFAEDASDVNGDGRLDLVAANGEEVNVYLGYGDGSFAPAVPPVTTPTGAPFLNFVALADFNADGRPDVAVNASVMLNDGDWSFPPPSVSVSDATVTEGNTGTVNATFTLTLSHASDVNVTVHYDLADITAAAGSDYAAASGDVTIPAGQISQTFTIAVKGDRLAEPTEAFAVNRSAPTNATIGDGRGIGTILDNEPRISINNVTRKEGNGKTTVFTFTITLSAAYDQDVTVNYATADGTAKVSDNDYIATSGTVTFLPGQPTTKTITVVVQGDKKKESNDTFFVNLSDPSSNALILDAQGIGTILNDDN